MFQLTSVFLGFFTFSFNFNNLLILCFCSTFHDHIWPTVSLDGTVAELFSIDPIFQTPNQQWHASKITYIFTSKNLIHKQIQVFISYNNRSTRDVNFQFYSMMYWATGASRIPETTLGRREVWCLGRLSTASQNAPAMHNF